MSMTNRSLRSAAAHRLGIAVSMLFLGTVALSAQTPQSQTPRSMDLSETIEVVEIQLEVLVTDRDGMEVNGLKASDFHVHLGGQPAEVLAVDRVGGAGSESVPATPRRALGTAPAVQGDHGLTLVLFVDQLHISPLSSWRILDQVVEFLRDALRPGDRVMVATFDGSVSIALPVTDDLKAVKKALVEVGQMQSRRLAVDEERVVMEQIRQLQDMSTQGRFQIMTCTNLESVAIGYATATHREMLATIAALDRFVDTLAGLPGRKALLHLSDGLPLIPGRGPYEYIIELCNGGEGTSRGVENTFDWGTDVTHTDTQKMRLDLQRYDTSQQWYQLAARANRNNVTFYPLQALGLRDVELADASSPQRDASLLVHQGVDANRQDSLSLVASETGGTAIINHNDVAPALARMTSDLRSYYLLSVRGTGGRAGDIHQLRVEVDLPGAEVRHRRSLHIQSRHQQVADRVLTNTLHVASDNPMALTAVLAEESATAGDLRNVRFNLQIPLAALTLLHEAPDQPAQGRFTVFVAASDLEGRTTPVRMSTVPVEVKAGDEDHRSYTFEVEMQMRAGEHVVGFGVLDEIGGGTSYLRTVVEG